MLLFIVTCVLKIYNTVYVLVPWNIIFLKKVTWFWKWLYPAFFSCGDSYKSLLVNSAPPLYVAAVQGQCCPAVIHLPAHGQVPQVPGGWGAVREPHVGHRLVRPGVPPGPQLLPPSCWHKSREEKDHGMVGFCFTWSKYWICQLLMNSFSAN